MGKLVPLDSLVASREEILKPDEKGSFPSHVAESKTKNSTSGPHSDEVNPASLILASAVCATCLGSLPNLPAPYPALTSQTSLALLTLSSTQGITPKVEGSGTRSMSDSWISTKPLTEEPSSFATPSVKIFSCTISDGMLTCLNLPGTSVNWRSMNFTFCACIISMTSPGVKDLGTNLPSLVILYVKRWMFLPVQI